MDKYERRRKNLLKLRDEQCDGKVSKLADKIGRAPSYVSRMLYTEGKDGKKRIADDMIELIEKVFSLPRGWLDEFHQGNVISMENYKNNSTEVNVPQFDTRGSMAVGLIIRDQPGTIQGWRVSADWVQHNIKSFTDIENLAIVTGFGDAMKGMFNPGDPVLVDRGVKSVEFDSVYFFRVGEEGFIKRLQRIPGIGLVAISENKAYKEWAITPEMDFEVFARVVKVWCSTEF